MIEKYIVKSNQGYFNMEEYNGTIEYGWLTNDFGDAEHTMFDSAEVAESTVVGKILSGAIPWVDKTNLTIYKVTVEPIKSIRVEKKMKYDKVSYFIRTQHEKVGPMDLGEIYINGKDELLWNLVGEEQEFPIAAKQINNINDLETYLSTDDVVVTLNYMRNKYQIYKIVFTKVIEKQLYFATRMK